VEPLKLCDVCGPESLSRETPCSKAVHWRTLRPAPRRSEPGPKPERLWKGGGGLVSKGTSHAVSSSAMVVRFFVFFAVAVFFAGCGDREYTSAPPRTSASEWNEGWRDPGSVVQDHIVGTGYAECLDAVILYVGWPLGTPFDKVDSARTYVRGPGGSLGPLDSDATLSKGARNTGYHLGDVQLWLGKDARKAAYLVGGSKVERWRRLIEPVGCV
jgi:hypothetical protein